jgi:hypothetical protein
MWVAVPELLGGIGGRLVGRRAGSGGGAEQVLKVDPSDPDASTDPDRGQPTLIDPLSGRPHYRDRTAAVR